MIITLEGTVDSTMFNKLINSYNLLREDAEKDLEMIIYLSSCGGNSYIANAIIDLINKHAQCTTLIAASHILSAAFSIFFQTKCLKQIVPATIGMDHLAKIDSQITEGGTIMGAEDQFSLKVMRRSKKESLSFYESIGMKQEWIDDILDGRDVYFTTKELETMLKTQNKNEIYRSNT